MICEIYYHDCKINLECIQFNFWFWSIIYSDDYNYRYGPPTRTEYRLIVENLSSRISWQVSTLQMDYVSSFITHHQGRGAGAGCRGHCILDQAPQHTLTGKWMSVGLDQWTDGPLSLDIWWNARSILTIGQRKQRSSEKIRCRWNLLMVWTDIWWRLVNKTHTTTHWALEGRSGIWTTSI